jgi:hypothetical protein
MSPFAALVLFAVLKKKSAPPNAQTLDDDNVLVQFDDGSLNVIGVNFGFAANRNNPTTIALRYGDGKAALAKWKALQPRLPLPAGTLRTQLITNGYAIFSSAGTTLVVSKPSVFRVAPDHSTIAQVFAGTAQQAASTWAAVRSQVSQ